jgi:hypothetical protein
MCVCFSKVVLVSAGFDAAAGDPLGGCCLTPHGYASMTNLLRGLAGGRLIVVLEGGFVNQGARGAGSGCVYGKRAKGAWGCGCMHGKWSYVCVCTLGPSVNTFPLLFQDRTVLVFSIVQTRVRLREVHSTHSCILLVHSRIRVFPQFVVVHFHSYAHTGTRAHAPEWSFRYNLRSISSSMEAVLRVLLGEAPTEATGGTRLLSIRALACFVSHLVID